MLCAEPSPDTCLSRTAYALCLLGGFNGQMNHVHQHGGLGAWLFRAGEKVPELDLVSDG